ncbi:MAG: 7-carboxy-7-deazaguanine synthase QueE [Nitrospirota bacterium]
MQHAFVQEVFSSIQGEGPRIGERQIFVRFQGCDIQCQYCDTPSSIEQADPAKGDCSIQSSLKPVRYEQISNPIPWRDLVRYCSRLVIPGTSHPTVSVTGGEPLLQANFLRTWLPEIRKTFTVYLETNGIHVDALEKVCDFVDVVSMDFKLPSATGLGLFWKEHEDFLSLLNGKNVFVKAVITRTTVVEDILQSARILRKFKTTIPLILQPAGGTFAPDASLLMHFQEEALGLVSDVRVIPQIHRFLGLP